jgi:hypothetical protein
MSAASRDLAAIAREQNDRDFAAGLLPTRYVEDVSVLDQVAVLIVGAGPPTKSEGPGASRRSLRHPSAPPEKVVAS